MTIKHALCLSISLMQHVSLIQADSTCRYYANNQSTIATTNCNDKCCSSIAMSAQVACCASISWSSLAVPIFIVGSVCLLIICLMYFRPLLKVCLCGHKCPCGNRSRVGTPSRPSVHDNPIYVMNNGDLPDYDTVIKDARTKEMTPPPYNFVTTHPADFGIEARVPSAPPQYRSRNSSVAVIEPPPIVS